MSAPLSGGKSDKLSFEAVWLPLTNGNLSDNTPVLKRGLLRAAVGYAQNKTSLCDRYHARRSGVDASSSYRQRAGWPAHSKEHVMRNWWIVATSGGGAGLIGVAVGDWYSVSYTAGMVLAGAGAAIGAVFGSFLAKASRS